MSRLEFTRKVRAEIILRATQAGVVRCEGCGLVLGKKPYEVDHTLPDGLRDPTDRRPLTAAEGKLLGKGCCHAQKTPTDVAQIAKMKRQRDRDTGAMLPAKTKIRTAGFAKRARPAPKPMPPHRALYGPRSGLMRPAINREELD